MQETILNKVSQSGLLTIDLSEIVPQKTDLSFFNIKPFLFRGLILREKEFREAMSTFDFSIFAQRRVCVLSLDEAIIPMWAYMLIASYITPFTDQIFMGGEEEAVKHFSVDAIQKLDIAPYKDQRIVIKGCGDKEISAIAYLLITQRLLPYAKSIMYGEPCSTVPIFKHKKNIS